MDRGSVQGLDAGWVLGWVQGLGARSSARTALRCAKGLDAQRVRMRKGFGCKAVCGLVPSWVQGSDAGLGACLAPKLPQFPAPHQGAACCLSPQCRELAEAPPTPREEPPAALPDRGVLAQPRQPARLPGGLHQPQPPALHPGCPAARRPRRVGGGGPGLRAVPELQLCLHRRECQVLGGGARFLGGSPHRPRHPQLPPCRC